MHGTDTLREADRVMTICNACRYCEGLCAVFPAMEMRRSFASGDLNYLANLCHGCSACFFDCQFSPPHDFNVNVPRTLAALRAETYKAYAWPRSCAGLFERNGLVISIITALSVTLFILGFVTLQDPAVLFASHVDEGAFYRLMPHNVMVAIFGAAFLYALLAIAMGVRQFWRDANQSMPLPPDAVSLWQAVKDAAQLRYLDGGGVGCVREDDRPTDRRRAFHHLTFYGFLLCFASTSVATLYHYLLGLQAPYPWYDLPVLLGTAGGIGLIIGPIGLLADKWRREPTMQEKSLRGMDVAFIVMLLLTSATGLALLMLRSTPAMGILLALHLGVVFSLFITMPYGKFVHGIYRFAALVRYAREQRKAHQPSLTPSKSATAAPAQS